MAEVVSSLRIRVLVLLAATGCAPGSIEWSTGDDLIRTALFAEQDNEFAPGTASWAVVLSTGIFECELPAFDNPEEQAEALAALATGACREDARHVTLILARTLGTDPVGRYPSDPDWNLGELGVETPRLAFGLYLGIEEASAERPDGLVPIYEPVQIERHNPLQSGGEVILRRADDVLVGQFGFPSARISGHFRATECTGDRTLFDLLQFAADAACP